MFFDVCMVRIGKELGLLQDYCSSQQDLLPVVVTFRNLTIQICGKKKHVTCIWYTENSFGHQAAQVSLELVALHMVSDKMYTLVADIGPPDMSFWSCNGSITKIQRRHEKTMFDLSTLFNSIVLSCP